VYGFLWVVWDGVHPIPKELTRTDVKDAIIYLSR
jgi:hypothetical protein